MATASNWLEITLDLKCPLSFLNLKKLNIRARCSSLTCIESPLFILGAATLNAFVDGLNTCSCEDVGKLFARFILNVIFSIIIYFYV